MQITTQSNSTVNAISFTAAALNNGYATLAVPEFCLSNFLTSSPKQGKAIKPSDKDVKKAAVAKLVSEGVELGKLHERYNEEFVVRGNKALYELLASIYSYALRINESEQKEQILDSMKAELKEKHSIKTTKNTHWLTTVVKFIVKTDRQTASNYSRVLQVAFDENLADKEMAGYIERRGGVAQIRETEAVASAKATSGDIGKERTEIMRDLLKLVLAPKSQYSFTYDGTFIAFPSIAGGDASKEGAAQTSTFCHFMAVQVTPGEYKVVSANDFSKGFEDVILKHMSASLPEDMDKIRKTVAHFKNKQQKVLDAELAARKEKILNETTALPA